MGKTLNTRPLRARRELWKEYHDHSLGECDLIPLKEYLNLPRRQQWRGRRCSWSLDWHKMYDTRCSCDLCRDPWGHRQEDKEIADRYPTSVDAW